MCTLVYVCVCVCVCVCVRPSRKAAKERVRRTLNVWNQRKIVVTNHRILLQHLCRGFSFRRLATHLYATILTLSPRFVCDTAVLRP